MFGDSARRGLVTRLAIAQRLVEMGFEVLEPVGNHLRYDLACYVPASAGEKAQPVCIQCKTAQLSRDKICLLFKAFNLGGERKRNKRGYQGMPSISASTVPKQGKSISSMSMSALSTKHLFVLKLQGSRGKTSIIEAYAGQRIMRFDAKT